MASRTQHDWSRVELEFLAEHEDDPMGELVDTFRKKFRKASQELSDRAIVNRRYLLLHSERTASTEDQLERAGSKAPVRTGGRSTG